jgi:signal recognition particle subunit SEC65
MTARIFTGIILILALPVLAEEKSSPISVDKTKKEVVVPCKIAPRKLPNLKETYPIEVIATWPAPKGQKAHETIVAIENVKPSELHKALEELGLKAGRPTREAGRKPEGPEVAVLLELPGVEGKVQRILIEQALVQIKTGKPAPALKWHFTGSVMREPDPEKDDKVYGADLTGTFLAIFPVTDDTVLQSGLSTEEEKSLKLETNTKLLPKEGTAVKLILQAKK